MTKSIASNSAPFEGILPLSRSSDLAGGGDGGAFEAGRLEVGGNEHPAPALERVRELESLLAQQQEDLTTAVKFLNQAAYLAKYHQPSLERHIRAFVNGLQC